MDKGDKGREGEGTSKEKIFIRTSFPSRVSFFLQLMTLVVVGGEIKGIEIKLVIIVAPRHIKIKLRIIEI